MKKQINSINGYSCVQVKVQFYDFSALYTRRAKRSMCDMLTHAFYSPPSPPHPKILYEPLQWLASMVKQP